MTLTGHFSMYIPINPFEIYQIEIIIGGVFFQFMDPMLWVV